MLLIPFIGRSLMDDLRIVIVPSGKVRGRTAQEQKRFISIIYVLFLWLSRGEQK